MVSGTTKTPDVEGWFSENYSKELHFQDEREV
jgi:hypothetical protein